MLLFDVLKADHRRVKDELEKMLTRSDEAFDKQQLVKICMELELHMQLEEELIYPKLQQEPEFHSLIKDAYEEHSQSKQMVQKLRSEVSDPDGYRRDIQKLIDMIDHHVDEEEKEVFPKMNNHYDRDFLEDMGNQVVREKERRMQMATK